MDIIRYIARIPGAQKLWRAVPVGPVDLRVRFDIWKKPAYAYGLYSAAVLAKKLNIPSISAIEFGVAGGRGLVALEDISERVSRYTGVDIAVLGFDSGKGMPEPADYRDLPHVWGAGFYEMDVAALKRRLVHAKLVLGDVAATVAEIAPSIPPVGFISFDLDYYSSTKEAFRIFDGPSERRLPRVHSYFDDIIWPERACHNEYTGEYLAINEFNSENRYKKICPIPHLHWMRDIPEAWNAKMYVFHDFMHPLYTANITENRLKDRQLVLS
jgi:hypothetical protein